MDERDKKLHVFLKKGDKVKIKREEIKYGEVISYYPLYKIYTVKLLNRNVTTNCAPEELEKISLSNNFNEKLSEGDHVKIKKEINEFGKVIRYYPSYEIYSVKLLNRNITMNCRLEELEKIILRNKYIEKPTILEKQLDKKMVESDLKLIGKFFNQNLKKSFNYLKDNESLRAIHALGYYYPKWRYPENYESDFYTKQVIKLKRDSIPSMEKEDIGRKIAIIFLNFINESEILRSVINKIDYIFMVPTQNYFNHVKYWGDILCDRLNEIDLSETLSLQKNIKYYKRSSGEERKKKVRGAFKLDTSHNSFRSLRNRNCLLLDDICTTGNQINEITNLLSKYGTNEVYAFVIGKTIREDF